MDEEVCKKCNGTGRIKYPDGTIKVCFDCLEKGLLDQHDKKLKSAEELGIKL